jgi:hypothetical protein
MNVDQYAKKEEWQEEELAWHGLAANGELDTWQHRWLRKGVSA